MGGVVQVNKAIFIAALGMTVIFSSQALADAGSLPAEACRMLVAPRPAPDVEYRPGVDVRGKPVVEADLEQSSVKMPESFSFDITVDVAHKSGLEMKGSVGTVTVEKDGRVTFNGEPLESPQEEALRALCAEKPALQKGKKDAYNK